MLAYAASRPAPLDRRPHPHAMLAIVALHVGVAAVVMSAKMDLPGRIFHKPEILIDIPVPKDPPPNPQQPHQRQQSSMAHTVDRLDPEVVTPTHPTDGLDPGPPTHLGADLLGGSGGGVNVVIPPPVHDIVRLGAKLLTSGEDLKPPYPASKLLTEEEASLHLRLTIDDQGRVIEVEPIGRADPVFLAAARRHLMAHWRYRPASEDGHAVSTTDVITLHFQLDG